MASLVPLSLSPTDIFPKLQAVNLLSFADLTPTLSYRTRPESKRFASRLGHGAVAFLVLDPPTSGRLGELCDKLPKHYDAVFHVVVCRIVGLPSSRILSTLRFPTACAPCNISVQAMRESVGVDMPDDAWALSFADR
jgi:hypothetical protein